MNVEIVARHVEIDDELRDFTRDRLGKLEKLLGPLDAHVVLESEKHRQRAEIKVISRYGTLTGAEETEDLHSSVRRVADKIEAQARRQKEKQIGRKKRRGPRDPHVAAQIAEAAAIDETNDEPAGPEVLERLLDGTPYRIHCVERAAPLMPVEDAAVRLTTGPETVVVFRESQTEALHVMLRRADGDFELIRPAD